MSTSIAKPDDRRQGRAWLLTVLDCR
jgi:hypothetical protein